MAEFMIQKIFDSSYASFCETGPFQSDVQAKAARAIRNCKSGKLGCNTSSCGNCGHTETHNNSCRNRNCPNCQAVEKERWVDKRRAEVIDAPYFHIVFTLPHELNPLLYCNQKLLYSLLHKCCAETVLELAADKKNLGAEPGIIQVLHTWNQDMDYHVHMHCIVSGGGLTTDSKIRRSGGSFFIHIHKLRDKFKGKFLALLDSYYKSGSLEFSTSCESLRNSYDWSRFRDSLYKKDWCPYIKETFNGFGNAIEYLGRYTNKIAISNNRIESVTDSHTTFSARGRLPGEPRRQITITNEEFIRRFLMHVLPPGFQKTRYYGFLNNRTKKKKLQLIFKLQGYQKYKERYTAMTMAELLKKIWNVDVNTCPVCGSPHMRLLGKTYVPLS